MYYLFKYCRVRGFQYIMHLNFMELSEFKNIMNSNLQSFKTLHILILYN